jgi:hypothetical protein
MFIWMKENVSMAPTLRNRWQLFVRNEKNNAILKKFGQDTHPV